MRSTHTALLIAALLNSPMIHAQSNLLESVKRNPQEAVELCRKFRALNSQGISASSKESIKKIADERNLNEIDAEIISIYVIGLHCPDVT